MTPPSLPNLTSSLLSSSVFPGFLLDISIQKSCQHFTFNTVKNESIIFFSYLHKPASLQHSVFLVIASLLGTQLETLKSSLTFLFTHLTSKLNGQVLRVSLHHASHSYPVDMCALYLSITGWHSLLKGPCSCLSPSLCLQTT